MRGQSLRRTAQLLVVTFVALIGLLVLPPAQACACGGVVDPAGDTTLVTRETALVVRHGRTETIVMSLAARSDATRAGLLVPTPAPATPGLADREVFSDLATQTAPRERTQHHFFGPPELFTSDPPGDGAAAPVGHTGVRVLKKVDLGPLQAVTLTASNADDLHTWLSRHHFEMSPEFRSLVTPYLQRGWAFTAMTLTPKGKSLSGDLPPVSLTFPSDKLVYPMRMSRGAKETQHVTTYVLADHRVARTDPTVHRGTFQVAYADRLRRTDLHSPDLRRLADGKTWITELRQTFDDPAHQVRSDFTFARAAHDTPVVSYYTTDEYFIPVDVAALLLVLVVLAAGGVVVIVRRVRRRPAHPA